MSTLKSYNILIKFFLPAILYIQLFEIETFMIS